MNDDSTHPPDHGPDDGSGDDDHLSPQEVAARDALRAAPAPTLGELDRRRLVRSAMQATEPAADTSPGGGGFSRRWMGIAAAAAAILVVVVVSVSLLSGNSGSDAPTADGGGGASSDATEEFEGPVTADAGAVQVVDLGDLGSFDDDASILRAFDSTGSSAMNDADARFLSLDSTGVACAEVLPENFVVVVVGTLTVRGDDAVILGGETPDGGAVAYLLDASDCGPFDGWDPRTL